MCIDSTAVLCSSVINVRNDEAIPAHLDSDNMAADHWFSRATWIAQEVISPNDHNITIGAIIVIQLSELTISA